MTKDMVATYTNEHQYTCRSCKALLDGEKTEKENKDQETQNSNPTKESVLFHMNKLPPQIVNMIPQQNEEPASTEQREPHTKMPIPIERKGNRPPLIHTNTPTCCQPFQQQTSGKIKNHKPSEAK